MLLHQSCTTTKEIDYRFVVPELTWPDFPEWEKEDEVVDFENRTVTLPLDVLFDLAEYKVDITATETVYNRLRSLANEL